MSIVSAAPYRLSMKVTSLWAKTGGKEQRHLWEPLYVHLADTAEIARLLWRRWVPEATKAFIAESFEMAPEDAEMIAVWLAGVHDIGKATPSFQSKVPEREERLYEVGFELSSRCQNYPHSFLGEVILKDWLVSLGHSEFVARGLASIVGGHHGANPTDERVLIEIINHSEMHPLAVIGDETWRSVQDELLDWVFSCVQAEQVLGANKDARCSTYAQIQLTGLVIMADWIASNTHLFPLVDKIDSWDTCANRAAVAWNKLMLPAPQRFVSQGCSSEELFHRRFASLSATTTLRPMQSKAVCAALCLEDPGLIIIEAPMGCGKTEASLLCAEILAERFGDGGLAYLLPTQATSNAMFTRVEEWLKLVLADLPGMTRQDLHLLHSKAALNEDYASLPAWGESWMGDGKATQNGDAVIAHQWFSGRKRGLLAPFVVGTVDQLLMAALKTKHAHLRHFGLSGKVVVIDEVHAYDAYMNVYLDRALSFLGAYRVPVILLSATLPPSRRVALVNAYRGSDKPNSRRARRLDNAPRLSSGDPAYPLITTSTRAKDSLAYKTCKEDGRVCCVVIEYLPDDNDALLCELRASLVDGGCACVLRNTVARAQATYELLRAEFGEDVRLTHSRFVAADRARNDTELTALLGPNAAERPRRLIVVATQVLEQSLDVDFDLLITDIAPIDLLLQRMGRLHRHARGEGECERPALLRRARCLITGVPDWGMDPPDFVHGIDAVYQPAILWKTILALRERVGCASTLTLPTDIAPLVESVYEGLVSAPEAWIEALSLASRKDEERRQAKRDAAKNWLLNKPGRYSLDGWMREAVNIDNEVRGRVAVRDSEESIEVVVVCQTRRGLEVLPWIANRNGVDPRLGSGADIPDDSTARVAALCTVNLPPRLSAPYLSEQVIGALERSGTFDGWQRSPWLAGVLPLVVDGEGLATIGWEGHEFVLRYSREEGLSLIGERRNEE
ncbi:MAG: CRISPR-associated helicase Cas3' [Atopobiaceae bacterium]|nr:CRISPR-associated helicase Cas3' [Atopobiaceae bacterium]